MCHPFDGRRSLIPIHQMLFQQTYRLFTFIYDQEKHCIFQLAGGITLNKRRKQLLPLIGGMTWKCMECIGCFSIFWKTETAFILIAKKTTNLMCLRDNMVERISTTEEQVRGNIYDSWCTLTLRNPLWQCCELNNPVCPGDTSQGNSVQADIFCLKSMACASLAIYDVSAKRYSSINDR